MPSCVQIERELEGTPFLRSSSFPSLVYCDTSCPGKNLIPDSRGYAALRICL